MGGDKKRKGKVEWEEGEEQENRMLWILSHTG